MTLRTMPECGDRAALAEFAIQELEPGPLGEPSLSAAEIRRLMRQHGQTIRGIAAKHGLTQKRVREVRAGGVTGFLAQEWRFLITGEWPDS